MITREQFVEYEKVRLSGITNMMAVNTVSDYTGLDREEIREIMHDYADLKEQYPLTEDETGEAVEMREMFQ